MLEQNHKLFWYCVGSPLDVKILKQNQLRTTELEINQQGGMWRWNEGRQKEQKRAWSVAILQGENATLAEVFEPSSTGPSESRVPFHHLRFLFYSLSPLIYFSLSGIDWLWFLFAAGRRAGLLNRTLQAHIHRRTITFSLLYILHYHLHIHRLREDRAVIFLQASPSLSFSRSEHEFSP